MPDGDKNGTGNNGISGMSLKAQKKKARQQRGTVKAKLTRKLEKFHKYVADQVALEILEDSYESVAKAYEEVEGANEQQYCNLLDEDSDERLIQEANRSIKDLEDRKSEAHVLYMKVKKEMQTRKPPRVKPIDVPVFQGDVREILLDLCNWVKERPFRPQTMSFRGSIGNCSWYRSWL